MSPDAISIPLDDKRRRIGLWWQKLEHVIGGAPLLLAGIDRLRAPGGESRALALAEIIVALVLLVMFARDLRAAALARVSRAHTESAHAHGEGVHAHGGPDWFEIVAGSLLILEAVHSVHPGGKPLYQHALLYLGAVTMATGLAHGFLAARMRRNRSLRIDDQGVHARLSRFRGFDVSWAEVLDVRMSERSVSIVTSTGAHEIRLSRYANAAVIRAALAEWKAHRALPRAI